MRSFGKKLLKALQRRGLYLQTPGGMGLCSRPRVATTACFATTTYCSTLSSAFLVINALYYYRKKLITYSRCFAFASVFHFKLCSFVDGGAKICFPQDAGYLATPLTDPTLSFNTKDFKQFIYLFIYFFKIY